MNATHADLTEGERTDVVVEFVTRRTVDAEGKRVHRLLVEDKHATRFAVLVAPETGLLAGLKTGATYRLTGLLGSSPRTTADREGEHITAGAEREHTTADYEGEDCPDCGAELRPGTVADAVDEALTAAADELDIDDTYGIVDDHTTISRQGWEGGTVDDWQPMGAGDERTTAPDYVCPACNRHVDAHELRRRRARGASEPDAVGEQDAVLETLQESTASLDAAASPETVGLAAGGATDVANFRENVENGYTPQPEAISDEGLFYDYYFETGERGGADGGTSEGESTDTGTSEGENADTDVEAGEVGESDVETDALFAPRYAAATSTHPVSGETERYLSVGLDSTLAAEDFQRPRLDLVAVLDVSGSMDSQFDGYYYDEHGRQREAETDATTKLDAATRSLCALTEQLHADDRLGVVLYNHRAHVAKPLRDVGATDMQAIRRHIKDVSAGGSTNLADGFEAAVDVLADAASGTPTENAERRVVFMTDMMPNTGTTGESDLTRLFADAADAGIHTTFVGMGLDENAELADALSGIRGANHYFVQSAAEFERRLGDEFEYMVTPLVYDLSLELDTEGYEIADVRGSPSASDATNRLMHVETLFPSAKQDGDARGGVVLVEVERTEPDGDLSLVASWTERDGSDHTERRSVTIPGEPDTYAHDGIRKATALARYADALRSWARDVHERASTASGVDDWLLPDARGEHERESVPLVVPDEHAERFRELRAYLREELRAVGDDSLQRELDLLETLCWEQPEQPREVAE